MAIERYIGAKQICERLSVSRSRAYEIMAELPRLKAGGSVRVSESSFARWVELRTVQPMAPYVPPRRLTRAEFWQRMRAPAMGDSASALARLRAELQAIPAAQVLQLNVSVPHAVTTITMSLPRVRQLQPRILVELPRFDTTLLDKLPDYARALFEAYLQCQTTGRGAQPRGELFKS